MCIHSYVCFDVSRCRKWHGKNKSAENKDRQPWLFDSWINNNNRMRSWNHGKHDKTLLYRHSKQWDFIVAIETLFLRVCACVRARSYAISIFTIEIYFSSILWTYVSACRRLNLVWKAKKAQCPWFHLFGQSFGWLFPFRSSTFICSLYTRCVFRKSHFNRIGNNWIQSSVCTVQRVHVTHRDCCRYARRLRPQLKLNDSTVIIHKS